MANSFAYPEPYQNVGTGGDIFSRTGGNIGGWPSKAAAFAAIAPDQRLGTVIAVMEGGKPVEYWWPGPGTADADLVPYNAPDAALYEPGKTYKKDTLVYTPHKVYAMVTADFTAAAPTLAQDMATGNAKAKMVARTSPYFGEVFSYGQLTLPVELVVGNNTELEYEAFEAGAHYTLTVGYLPEYSYPEEKTNLKLGFKAGSRVTVNFNPDHFFGELPPYPATAFAEDTVLEWEFYYRNCYELGLPYADSWRWVWVKNATGTSGPDHDTLRVFPYAPGLVLEARDIVVQQNLVVLAQWARTTTGQTLVEDFNLSGGYVYKLVGNGQVNTWELDQPNGGFGTVWDMQLDSTFDEYHLRVKAGAPYTLRFNHYTDWALLGRLITVRITLEAGAQASVGYEPALFLSGPTVPMATYATETVLEYQFMVLPEPQTGEAKFAWLPQAHNLRGEGGPGGTVYAQDVVTNAGFQFVSQEEKDTWDAAQTPAARTGTVLRFDQDSGHGSAASPVTGSISIDTTGLQLHTVAVVYHNAPSAPSLDARMYPYKSSKAYEPGVLNTIMVMSEGGDSFGYVIDQKVTG